MARKRSDPDIRGNILIMFMQHGAEYVVPSGQVVYPNAPQDGPGIIVQAKDTRSLRAELDLEYIPLNKFSRALGSLMYHYGAIRRCHIDGDRHFKFLVGF